MVLNTDCCYFCLVSVMCFFLTNGEVQHQFDKQTENITAIQGQNVVLPCAVLDKGSFKIGWMNPHHILLSTEDRRVIDDDRMSVERPNIQDWNLLIRHVAVSDNGQYTCHINTDPIQIKRVWLTVHVPAQIDNETSSVDTKVREGDTVKLTCVATGKPEPDISWYRKTLQSQQAREQVGTIGEVLVIHNISRYCGGLYECEAKNSVGNGDRRSINVDVEFPPEVKFRTPHKMSQSIGRETMLECFITAFPQAVSQWQKDGEPVIRENGGKYRTEIYKEDHFTVALYLRILNLEAADFGIYTCEASNNLGTDYDRMNLYEYTNPTPPKPTSSPTLEPWRYGQHHDQVIKAEVSQSDQGFRSRSQGPHLSGFVGAGQVYNRSSPAVLPHIYQNIIAVIVLTFSIIFLVDLVR